LTCFAGTAYRPYRPAKGQLESLKVMRCFRIHFLNFCSLVFKDPSCSRPPTSDDSAATGWLLRLPLEPGAFRGLAASCEGGGLYSSAFCPSTSFFNFFFGCPLRLAAAVSGEAASTLLLPPRQPLFSVAAFCSASDCFPTPLRLAAVSREAASTPSASAASSALLNFFCCLPAARKTAPVRGARCVLPGPFGVNDLFAQCVRKIGFRSGEGLGPATLVAGSGARPTTAANDFNAEDAENAENAEGRGGSGDG
jgi:hypothetical protein